MGLPRREEPFSRLVRRVLDIRKEAADTLCAGRWDGEAEALRLVGQIRAMDDIIAEMREIAGPDTHFGESDL